MGRESKARKRARQREKRLKHGMPLTRRTARNEKDHKARTEWSARDLSYKYFYKCKCRGE